MESHSARLDIRQLDNEDILSYLHSIGEKPFRAGQIFDWLWKKHVTSFDLMLNLPKSLRDRLKSDFVIRPISLDLSQRSFDGTVKNRYTLFDGHKIEAVLIPVPEDNRYTVCVSCQVGCSLTCSFCATGKMKRIRNLEAAEIVDQVVDIHNTCLEIYNKPITNIVYMGMGEPLLAYQPVLKSIEIITSPSGLGFSSRRITISTAGVAKMIKKLADDNPKVNLALSLHAADDEKRSQIMPINETNNLTALMDSLEYFYRKTKCKITFEYIALKDFNDTIEDAKKLAALTKRFPVNINIIEYNPIEDSLFERSDDCKLDRFMAFLVGQEANVTLRRSRGKDIDAACGQLANKE